MALRFLSFLMCVGFAGQSLAQAPPDVRPRRRPPVLLVRVSDKLEPLTLSRVGVEALITGFLSRTTVTMTFDNPNDRAMEGELVFPLPEGATVSSYGLDIGGEVVEASVVEREKARIVFEEEVRKGIDPGLVEWTQGSNFRTRVWPIPARGKRTVRVQYVSDLVMQGSDAYYHLPLASAGKVAKLELKVEVVRGPAEPKIASGSFANLRFKRWEERFVAETTRDDVTLGEDLRIALPSVPRRAAVVESGPRQGHYFFISDAAPAPAHRAGAAMARPRRIGILWDASLSRARADKRRELALLGSHLRALGDVEVEIVAFRNVPDEPVRMRVQRGNADAVLRHLEALPYDGATDLGALRATKGASYWLLFSDGLSTIGRGMPQAIEAPLFAVNGASTANHAFLSYVARKSGGAYFNLARATDDEVLMRLRAPASEAWQLLRVDYDATQVADVYPAEPRPVTGRVQVTGRLLAARARVKLLYGRSSPEEEVVVELSRDGAGATGLVARAWAQERVHDLALFTDKNYDALLDVGKAFQLVTPATSMIVLETLEQHLQHGIAPAKSRGELYTKYVQASGEQRAAKERGEKEKLEEVVQLWQERVKWWETVYEVPAGFRWQDSRKKKGGARERNGRDRDSDGIADTADVMARPAPAAPRAEAPREAAPEKAKDSTAKKQSGSSSGERAAGISIKPWDPQTPYIAAMKEAGPAKAYEVYLREREKYFSTPAFYLDCAEHLFGLGQRALGIRVVTSVAELKLEDPQLLRIVAHKAEQESELDLSAEIFEQVLRLRPEEPQSYRDLALVLGRRAERGGTAAARTADVNRALALFKEVVMGRWDDRFPEIETIVLMEANRTLAWARRHELTVQNPLDPRLVKLLDADLRILLTWHTDLTDMDLWVTEPTGEKCDYSHNRTTIGGRVSRDFTRGYGPEEYVVRKGQPGEYLIQANFYGSSQVTLTGGTVVQATVITNFGRANEQRRAITVRLQNSREVIDIGKALLGK